MTAAIAAATASRPSAAASARSPSAPRWLAATAAARSARFSSTARDGHGPLDNRRRIASQRGSPAATSSLGGITTPSSARVVASGGIEPGRLPPISAWWARLAA